MTHALTTPREAETLLARLFAASNTCRIKVSENRAFVDSGWLELGSLTLDPGGNKFRQILTAARRGAFEWKVPALDETISALIPLLGLKTSDREHPKLRRALDAMAAIAVRLGLRYPRFDPHALEKMPFRRSTTVVADTSAIIQGGLDFVARHLHPAARIKVPAIAQMEIVNFAERFLSTRRASKIRRPDLLIDHILSQAGQRVLLRLELNSDTEIERNFLLGDPLRNAFQKDTDADLQDLNLSVRIKTYADRLILETARQHQAQSTVGHRVQLLTSDQALARMALAEGIAPAYFASIVAEDLFGKLLTGTTLDPFTGQLRECSVAALLWELATAFGGVRIEGDDPSLFLEIAAFGDGLAWSPVHSQADLLWCDHRSLAGVPLLTDIQPERVDEKALHGSSIPTSGKKAGKGSPTKRAEKRVPKPPAPPLQPTIKPQRFNVGRMISLVDALDSQQILSESDVINVVGAKNREGLEDYRRFLLSGNLINIKDATWVIEPLGQKLAIAMRNEDITSVRDSLTACPSFKNFFDEIRKLAVGQLWETGDFARAATTYRTLGEITLICASIDGEGVFATPSTPTPEEFAVIAKARFRDLDIGDGLVSTGAWLEALIRHDGIHPEVARARLSDASQRGLLRRSAEGSTTDVRHERHVLQVLRNQNGQPTIQPVHLYRGDYLIPGTASTSIRIEEPQQ